MYKHHQSQTKISSLKKNRLWRTNKQEQQVDGEDSIWNETSRKWYGCKSTTGAMSVGGELAAGKHGVKKKLSALQETYKCTRKRCPEYREVRNWRIISIYKLRFKINPLAPNSPTQTIHNFSIFQAMRSKKQAKRAQSTRCHHPLPCQVSCLSLSRFYLCVQQSNKDTRKQRAVNSLSKTLHYNFLLIIL